MIKEEYLGQDTITNTLKKEEDIPVKIEEQNLSSFLRNQLEVYNKKIAQLWANNSIEYKPSSYNLNLHPVSKQPSKPFKVIRQPPELHLYKSEKNLQPKIEEDSIEEKSIQINIKPKTNHVSACKNYIALLCLGISRTVLTAEDQSQISKYITDLFDQRKRKFELLESQNNDVLTTSLRKHIFKTMCGKKTKKSRRKKDFKIRNTQELENLITINKTDSETVRLMKEVLKEIISYFFDSECYDRWLSTCMMSETNRQFFLKNKEEIQKKFLNPSIYKPHFSHASTDSTD